MSNFTYEKNENRDTLETYEWDNTWIDHANDGDTPRVLFIGDSISCGTRKHATTAAENRIYFDGLGTSKALDNPFFFDSIRCFARQQGYRNAILFNNGLHGWHLSDEEDYPHFYEQAVKRLLEEFPNTPLILVLTTSIVDEKREARVKKRNAAVLDIAARYGLPVSDLYSLSVELSKEHTDGVHFNMDAYITLSKRLLDDVRKYADL